MYVFKSYFIIILLTSIVTISNAQNARQRVDFVKVSTQSRGIAVAANNDVWYVTSSGAIGCWSNGVLKFEKPIRTSDTLDYRSIAVLDNGTIVVANAGSPAFLLKSFDNATTFVEVYVDKRPQAFIDCIYFLDDKYGYVLGDPIDSVFQNLTSTDGGTTWQNVDARFIPKAQKNEVAFASSNSNINELDGRIVFATGGQSGRLLFENSEGEEHLAKNTPMLQDSSMQGIYSIDISKINNKIVIAGGDYKRQTSNRKTIFVSEDEGASWVNLNTKEGPSYVSCVKISPINSDIIITGGNGLYITYNAGKSWQKVSDENVYTLCFDKVGKRVFYSTKK